MEQEKKIEPKTVNLTKLKSLNNQQLEERIKEIPIKIKNKQDYYSKMHQTNLERLKIYVAYKREEEAACKKMLADRQRPTTEKKVN
ncbi:MAG: hypothetical protein HYV97_14135 [Bdellovibrio sp.]|nr:hypothetical protein [Bdellovibrio sp.]